MSIHSKIISVIIFIILCLVLQRCANPVSPVGGPVDTQPPQFVKAEPPLFSKNFKSDKVRIYFDEFLELKDISSQLIVSPPMKKAPDIKLIGKSIIVEFKEQLRENTTYNIYFGESVTDLTENNPVSNFQYIFSTGEILDSLLMEGNIRNAFNLETVQGVNIMLYPNTYDTIEFDSVPYLVRPYYLTRSDKNGNFVLHNLKNDSYKIFALLDGNSNLIYDQPSETIGFIDSLITPWVHIQIPKTDSLETDSIQNIISIKDTVQHQFLSMLLFDEADSIQKLNKAFLAGKNKIQFIFKIPTEDYEINPLNIGSDEISAIREINKSRDTITIWLLNNAVDTIIYEVKDRGIYLDTVSIGTVKKQIAKKTKKKENTPNRPGIKFNLIGKVILPDSLLRMTFDYPLISFDTAGIRIVDIEDTLIPKILFTDSIRRTAFLDFPWKVASNYKLIIPDSVITDIIGRSNDSIVESFRTKPSEDYGNFKLSLTLDSPGENHIIQWLNKDEIIIKEILVRADTTIHFTNEEPGTYFLKLIYDKNYTNKWDSGNYIFKLQPEEIIYFEKQIDIRANWDIEEEWDI